MTQVASRGAARQKRHERIRLRLSGSPERPRLVVFRSNKHISAQVIDDTSGKTLAAASSLEKELRAPGQKKTDEAQVVGDGAGHVGVGLGKAGEVPESIRKGVEDAKKHLIKVPMVGTTIPHEVRHNFGASRIMLKPASQGTGVIAGGAVRAVVEAAGIRDILAKVFGSSNPVNVTRATLEALGSLRSAEEISAMRGVTVRSYVSGQPSAEVSHGR